MRRSESQAGKLSGQFRRRSIVKLTQAGHPHPIVQRKSQAVEVIGEGGLPVVLIPGAEFGEFEVQLSPGDRLFLGSDGITECETIDGVMLDDQGLVKFFDENADLVGHQLLEALMWMLNDHVGETDFADDISGVLLEFHGVRPNN